MSKQKYAIDGREVPGVTTVLGLLAKPALIKWANNMGLQGINTTNYVDTQATIGKICHAMIEEDIKKMLDIEPTPIEQLLFSDDDLEKANTGFLRWVAFRNENNFEPIASELRLVSMEYFFGGTIDIYCKLNGRNTLIDMIENSGRLELFPDKNNLAFNLSGDELKKVISDRIELEKVIREAKARRVAETNEAIVRRATEIAQKPPPKTVGMNPTRELNKEIYTFMIQFPATPTTYDRYIDAVKSVLPEGSRVDYEMDQ